MVPAALDVDAVHYAKLRNRFLLSFDTGAVIDGIPFSDEDILDFDVVTGEVELAGDSS